MGRYPSANDTDAGLLAGRRHQARPSLGVLKFINQDDRQDRHCFADGLTEEMITTLSKISKLTVVACPETLLTEDGSVDARHISTVMDVRYLLYGSVSTCGHSAMIAIARRFSICRTS